MMNDSVREIIAGNGLHHHWDSVRMSCKRGRISLGTLLGLRQTWASDSQKYVLRSCSWDNIPCCQSHWSRRSDTDQRKLINRERSLQVPDIQSRKEQGHKNPGDPE